MEPILIGPYDLGLQTNAKPFMIPDKAYPSLENATVFRGRVEKKMGYKLLGRLRRVAVATTIINISAGGAGTFGFTILGSTAQIMPGNLSNITITISAPIAQTLINVTGTSILTVVGAGPITAATINYATGVVSITFSGAAASSVATFSGTYYPGLPVMGIRLKEIANQINQEVTIFFDTRYAYEYTGGQFSELPSTLPTTWSGDDTMQFWATNYQKDASDNNLFWTTNSKPGLHGYDLTAATKANPMVLITSNPAPLIQAGDTVYLFNMDNPSFNFAIGLVTLVVGNVITTNIDSSAFAGIAATSGIVLTPNRNISGDGIRYWNGSTWKNYNPLLNSASALAGALLIIPYHQYFIALNTTEGNTVNLAGLVNYAQRARWCYKLTSESVLVSNFTLIDGWRDDKGGSGSFEDAPTEERIITAGFVKDQLIVEFERSSWQLVYTQNDASPFYWQRIDAELGSESTFSAVVFDGGLLTFGNVGIHQCGGTNTKRIDELIPEIVFDTHNVQDGPKRTSGIRDYFKEMVYFAYVTGLKNTEDLSKRYYPDNVLVYNYRNQTWSTWQDCVTSYGYYQAATGQTWADWTQPWTEYNDPWSSAINVEGFLSIAFGSQQGFVNNYVSDASGSDPTLFIQSLAADPSITGTIQIVSPQHNLYVGQYVKLTGFVDAGLTALNGTISRIVKVADSTKFTIDRPMPVGTYTVGGVISVVANISIKTKMFTPYWERGNRYLMNEIRFLFDKTVSGELQVNVWVDFGDSTTIDNATTTGVRRGSPVVSTSPELGPNPTIPLPFYSMQQFGAQIWKKFYCDAQGETFQIELTMNDAQMKDAEISEADIVLHGMMLYPKEIGDFN